MLFVLPRDYLGTVARELIISPGNLGASILDLWKGAVDSRNVVGEQEELSNIILQVDENLSLASSGQIHHWIDWKFRGDHGATQPRLSQRWCCHGDNIAHTCGAAWSQSNWDRWGKRPRWCWGRRWSRQQPKFAVSRSCKNDLVIRSGWNPGCSLCGSTGSGRSSGGRCGWCGRCLPSSTSSNSGYIVCRLQLDGLLLISKKECHYAICIGCLLLNCKSREKPQEQEALSFRDKISVDCWWSRLWTQAAMKRRTVLSMYISIMSLLWG